MVYSPLLNEKYFQELIFRSKIQKKKTKKHVLEYLKLISSNRNFFISI